MGKNANDLEQLVDVINGEQPDMICFTGDIVEEHPSDLVAGVAALQRLQAPLGKYAILGNHDYLDDVVAITKLLQQGDFEVLINEHRLVRRQDGILAMVGLDDQLLGNPDVQKATRGVPEEACRILLMHEPDYADRVPEELKFRLQLSGHRSRWTDSLAVIRCDHYAQGIAQIHYRRLSCRQGRTLTIVR